MDLNSLMNGEEINNIFYINYNKENRPTLEYDKIVNLYRKITGREINCFLITIHQNKKAMKSDIIESYPEIFSYSFLNEKKLEGLCNYPQDIFLFDANDRRNDRYIYVLLHELTHYSDNHDFCIQFCEGNDELYKKHMLYESFAWWSEFHAHYFVDTYRLDRFSEFDLNHLKNKEKNKITNIFEVAILNRDLYEILQGFARIIALSIDIDDLGINCSEKFEKIKELYHILSISLDFESVLNNFEKLFLLFKYFDEVETDF